MSCARASSHWSEPVTPPDLSEPRRTSPLAALFVVFQPGQLRNLLPIVVVAVSSGYVLVIALAGAVVSTLYGALSWWRREWSFADGVLRLDEGVLVRNQRRIPIERIQHVEIEQRLRHQLFGLAAIRVETAGGSDAELRLDAISHAEASTLQSEVLARLRTAASVAPVPDGEGDGESEGVARQATVMPPPPPPPPEVLVRLPNARLFIAGVLGPEIVAVLVALGFVLDTVGDLGLDLEDVDLSDAASSATRLALGAVLLLLVAGWVAIAGLVSVVRKWGLTALIAGDELRVSYGLLRKNEFVVKTTRIRDVQIAERIVLRPLHRADLRVRTAGSGSGDSSRVDVPMLSFAEIERILQRVLPAAVPLPAVEAAPPAARRRSLVRSAIVGSLVAMAAGGAIGVQVPVAGLALGVVILGLALAYGELWYRGLGLARTSGTVHSRSGALSLRRQIVPDGRVQSAGVRASFFQRRRGLATTRLDLAGAAVAVVDRDGATARHLAAELTTV